MFRIKPAEMEEWEGPGQNGWSNKTATRDSNVSMAKRTGKVETAENRRVFLNITEQQIDPTKLQTLCKQSWLGSDISDPTLAAKVYFRRAQLRLRSPDRREGHAHRRGFQEFEAKPGEKVAFRSVLKRGTGRPSCHLKLGEKMRAGDASRAHCQVLPQGDNRNSLTSIHRTWPPGETRAERVEPKKPECGHVRNAGK
ncbi:hypothetical protein MG293_010506 [Ovis ammon polii]|uniref:Uncharacterized protein n=1 Tax=Ovis ammon polii TaxID=230172 RepID=A0AAD4U6Y6_OVIAM|nr:hypothetical protein MG293_010506 [Ovis ammon polii]